MKYRWYGASALIFGIGVGMEIPRENKLILSTVQNNTRAYYRLSVMDLKCELSIGELCKKAACAPIEPFFLAERLSQSLPSHAIALKGYHRLKNALIHQGFIKIEDLMCPKNHLFLIVRQECLYGPRKLYSLFMALYDHQMNCVRIIRNDKDQLLNSNALATSITVVINSERLTEIEVEVTSHH